MWQLTHLSRTCATAISMNTGHLEAICTQLYVAAVGSVLTREVTSYIQSVLYTEAPLSTPSTSTH